MVAHTVAVSWPFLVPTGIAPNFSGFFMCLQRSLHQTLILSSDLFDFDDNVKPGVLPFCYLRPTFTWDMNILIFPQKVVTFLTLY